LQFGTFLTFKVLNNMTILHYVTLLPVIIRGTSILNKRFYALYWKVNKLLLKISNILGINLIVKCLGVLSWLILLLPSQFP
jgi:hypothetical protein